MNEQEWLASEDPAAMLKRFQTADWKVCPTPRQLRLFACACCRAVFHLLTDPRSRRAVQVAERYADGLATGEELSAGREIRGYGGLMMETSAATRALSFESAAAAARHCSKVWAEISPTGCGVPPAVQATLLRDIIGNPWRPVALPWPTPTVLALATAAYADRDEEGRLAPDRLLVLTDALEEAECNSEELLRHLRGPGPHVRGCWAIDLLLGKE